MRLIALLTLSTLITPARAATPVSDALACAAWLETGVVQEAGPTYDRTFGLVQKQAHQKMQQIFGRAERGFEKIRVMLELAGGWGHERAVRLDERDLAGLDDGRASQRRLKTISQRLWRAYNRTPVFTQNLLGAREVNVGETAIRTRLLRMRVAAQRMQNEYDAAPAAEPTVDRLSPGRFAGDLLAVLGSGALAVFNTGSLIHAVGHGNYLLAAVNAALFYVVARPVFRAKIESLYLAGRQGWRIRVPNRSADSPAAVADSIIAHVDEVLRKLRRNSKHAFVYYGATIDLDLRRNAASTHPLRRRAPTAIEVVNAAVARKDLPRPTDPRRLEVDAVFRYDEQLQNFVYASQIWEPPYSTESTLWGW